MCNFFPAYAWTNVHKYPVGFCIYVQLFSCIYMNKCAQIFSEILYTCSCFPAYAWTNVHKYPVRFCIRAALFLNLHEQLCTNIQWGFVYVQLFFLHIYEQMCTNIQRCFVHIYICVCSCFPTYAWTNVPKYPLPFTPLHSSHRGNMNKRAQISLAIHTTA